MAIGKTPTFEEINKHIEAAHLPLKVGHGTDAAAAQVNLCAIYKVVKPILQLVSMFAFFPAKWQAALALYLQAMDVFCPLP